jgi:hypothetical protein
MIGIWFLYKDDDKGMIHRIKERFDNIKQNFNYPIILFDRQRDIRYHTGKMTKKELMDTYLLFETLIEGNQFMDDITKTHKKIKPSAKDKEELLKFLKYKLNSKNLKFINLTLDEDFVLIKNDNYYQLSMFTLNCDLVRNKKTKIPLRLVIDMTFRFDQPTNIFMSQVNFANRTGVFKFSSINIVNKPNPNLNKPKNYPVQLNRHIPTGYKFNYTDVESSKDTVDEIISSISEEQEEDEITIT